MSLGTHAHAFHSIKKKVRSEIRTPCPPPRQTWHARTARSGDPSCTAHERKSRRDHKQTEFDRSEATAFLLASSLTRTKPGTLPPPTTLDRLKKDPSQQSHDGAAAGKSKKARPTSASLLKVSLNNTSDCFFTNWSRYAAAARAGCFLRVDHGIICTYRRPPTFLHPLDGILWILVRGMFVRSRRKA